MKTIYKYLSVLLLVFLSGVALSSCSREDYTLPDETASNDYMKIRLNLPAMRQPAAGTRAMTYEQENTLDAALLKVFIVDGTAITEAPLVGTVVYDEQDHSKATITVKLPKSEDASDVIRLCVVANSALPTVTSYAELKLATFDANDKWPTTQAIPMWGESAEFVVDDAMAVQTINMYRALARIDVGLRFVSSGDKFTETVTGLDNFTINSVAVYCTSMSGYIATGSSLDAPYVPPGVARRDYTDPLIYGPLGGIDGYIREIYVPESVIPDPYSQNAMHVLVVGGFFEGSLQESFYRLEFARDNGDGTKTELPILRNRRYVFNIREIVGSAYASREEAFQNRGAVSDRVIDYDVDVLDEFVHRVELADGYYLGLDNRNIMFDPQANLTHVVGYQTDLPASETITLEWSDPATGAARYELVLDTGAKSISIRTLTENISGETYTDTLYMKTGPFSIPILVQQECVNFRYAVNCENISVNGVYVVGEALNPTAHYIDISITAEDNSINGQTYMINTEELEGTHGISFGAAGTFALSSSPPHTMNIRLPGSGTLSQAAGEEPFKLQIKTNSGLQAYCETTIVPVNSTMNIVVMSPRGELMGTAIDRLVGGAGQVFNHPNNFGPYDYSIVKIEGFNYINYIDNGGDYDFYNNTNSDIYKWVTGIGNNGKIADMVYMTYPAVFGNSTAQLLAAYLDKGGVIIAFMETAATTRYLINNLYGISNIAATQGAAGGPLYPMPANPVLVPDDAQRDQVLRQFQGDPILDGPFGDVRDKQIGDDRGHGCSISNLPTTGQYEDIVTVYSYFNNINAATAVTNSTSVFGFKYEDDSATGRNLFYWGDGGIMASYYSGTTGIPAPSTASATMYPFYWDTGTMFPTPRPSYGSNASKRMPAFNSALFCNVMAWGVKKSQELKARRLANE